MKRRQKSKSHCTSTLKSGTCREVAMGRFPGRLHLRQAGQVSMIRGIVSSAVTGAPATRSSSVMRAAGACQSRMCRRRRALRTTRGFLDRSNFIVRPTDQSLQSAPSASACVPASARTTRFLLSARSSSAPTALSTLASSCSAPTLGAVSGCCGTTTSSSACSSSSRKLPPPASRAVTSSNDARLGSRAAGASLPARTRTPSRRSGTRCQRHLPGGSRTCDGWPRGAPATHPGHSAPSDSESCHLQLPRRMCLGSCLLTPNRHTLHSSPALLLASPAGNHFM
eukprot:5331963-Amphidinium_carterae.2